MTNRLLQVDAVQLLREHGQTMAEYFQTFRARFGAAPGRLMDSIEYSLTAGGKRLRPALVLECWHACGAKPLMSGDGGMSGIHGSVATFRSALAAAAAIELIHTFSLVHDDLPSMDDDDMRRGRPTNHKVFGEALAILAGDAMVTLAFEILASDADPAVAPALVRELASASGPTGMIGGQVLDIEGENVSLELGQLRRLHALKTGALLTSSCRLGAIAAKSSEHTLLAVTNFGRHLGLAFQIVDDLLDVTASPEQLGKATKKDVGRGKNTYPSLLGIDGSRREADQQLQAAMAAIADLDDEADGLRMLARFVVQRDK